MRKADWVKSAFLVGFELFSRVKTGVFARDDPHARCSKVSLCFDKKRMLESCLCRIPPEGGYLAYCQVPVKRSCAPFVRVMVPV